MNNNDLTWPQILYNLLIHSMIIGFSGYIGYLSFFNEFGVTLFSWHPPLLLIGVSVLGFV